MKIRIEKTLCAGHARCASIAPELFVLGDDGYIAIDGFEVRPEDEQRARRGALACPERAIRVET